MLYTIAQHAPTTTGRCHGFDPRQTLYVLMVLLIGSCITPMDQFADYTGGQIVIHGQVSPIEETNVVFVGRTSSLERLPEPIIAQRVALIDDLGNEYLYSSNPESGNYELKNFTGVPGRTYYLSVSLSEGRRYESVPEKMPSVLGIDEVYYSIEPDQYTDQEGTVAERDFLKIFLNYEVSTLPDPVFIKWHVIEVFAMSPTDFPDPFNSIPPPCYISQQVDPQRIVLFSKDETNASHVPYIHIASRLIDHTFKERHYFITYQSALTREAYDYWAEVDIVANQTGSIFDAPPARIQGNISNVFDPSEEVHGYFQAVNQTFTRFFLVPDDMPYILPLHCEYRPGRTDYPSGCLDCLSVRNSSHNRPDWF